MQVSPLAPTSFANNNFRKLFFPSRLTWISSPTCQTCTLLLQHKDHLFTSCNRNTATPLVVSTLDLPALDTHFEDFMASTLHFEENYTHSQHSIAYKRDLCQIRHGIKCGGFGLTSSLLVAPAASYVALRDFNQWNILLASLCRHCALSLHPAPLCTGPFYPFQRLEHTWPPTG